MTTENRDAIIDKIKKLLEMTEQRGATQAEAIQFALKAQQLIAEYEVQDYELGSCEEEPIERAAATVATTRTWRGTLAQVIADGFRCKTYLSQSEKRAHYQVQFYGYRHDVQAAVIIFDRLYEMGNKLAREKVKQEERNLESGEKLNKRVVYDSFVLGFVEGVRSELEKQTQALMLVCPQAVVDSYEEFSKDFSKTRRVAYATNTEIKETGYAAGKDAVRAGRMGNNRIYALAT